MGKTKTEVVWGVEFGGSAVRLVRVTRTGPPECYRAVEYRELPLDDRWDSGPPPPAKMAAGAGVWGLPPKSAAALAAMSDGRIGESLVACVGDELILFRTLSLPEGVSKRARSRLGARAGPDALDKMVRAQLEVLIPTQVERFATGYRAWADPHKAGWQRVLACAARRDALVGPIEGCKRLGREPDGVVPSIMALAAMWGRLAPRRDADGLPVGPALLLDVAARCTSLAVVDGGKVIDCGVIDQGGDHWTERIAEELGITCPQAETRKLQYATAPGDAAAGGADPAVHDCLQRALGEWARQLREASQNCVEPIPQPGRPRRCVLFGRSARMPGLAALVGETLGLEVQQRDLPRPAESSDAREGGWNALTLSEGMDLDSSAAAIGAALCAMEDDWPAGSLAGPSEETLRERGKFRNLPARCLALAASSWSWAALIVWLLAAVFALYGLDRVEANRLDDALRDVRAQTDSGAQAEAPGAGASQGGLARRLAIGGYLENAVPTPLDVLDRLSELLPDKGLLTSWQYSRTGDMVVEGTVPNEKEFLAMLGKLCELGEVEWKSGRPDKNKFRFEIHLQVGRQMLPTTTQEAPKDKEAPPKPPTVTKPATQPTTRPATGPASGTAPAAAAARKAGGS